MIRSVRGKDGERRMLLLIQKWLEAGVPEDGQWSATKDGVEPPMPAFLDPRVFQVVSTTYKVSKGTAWLLVSEDSPSRCG